MTSILPTISTVAGFAYEVIRKDHDHFYGLLSPVDYGEIITDRFAPFDYSDEFITFRKKSEKSFGMIVQSFDASTEIWDGTSMLPDKGTKDLDALLKASVGHDVIYERAKKISEATGIPESALLAFADDILKLSADLYGCSKKTSNIVWKICRVGGTLYHRLMKLFTITALSMLLAGCSSDKPENHTTILNPIPPAIHWVIDGITNHFEPVTDASPTVPSPTNDVVEAPGPVQEVPATIIENQEPSQTVPAFEYVSFGSPNCSRCVEDPEVQIKDFKWTQNGLSYRWAKGNLRNWGVKDDHDHNHALAVTGWFDGKTWRFAKFDWISTDRLTRDFENVRSGYNGFSPSQYFSAKSHGFFIMSEDGKKRTNILHD